MKTSEINLKGWISLTLLRFGDGRWTIMLSVLRRVGFLTRNGKCYHAQVGRDFFLRRRGVPRDEFERWVAYVRRTSGPIPGLD